MKVRKIKEGELLRTQELFAIAFESALGETKTAEDYFAEVVMSPESREDKYWQEKWAAFLDDDKTMTSYLVAQPFPIRFDGCSCRMTGIGGVSSLPQYRRCGGIRGCFEAALPSMYKDGIAFSYLYPFSTAYYRKFGYEMGCRTLTYHVRLDSIRRFEVSGGCELVEPDNLMLDDIKTIYVNWQNRYNLMVENEEFEYAWVKDARPAKDQVFTYVYRSADGTPKGYMTVRQEIETDGRNVTCDRFVFTDTEGLKGLINLLIALGSDHAFANFSLPTDIDMSLIIPEWSMGAARRAEWFKGMVRVVNAEEVLKMAQYRGEGIVKLAISDKQIEENNAVFEVSFRNGRAEKVNRLANDSACDVSMDINAFSRLIIGEGSTASFDYMDNVKVYNMEKLDCIFYAKPAYIMQSF